jgi:hypothetical protein
MSTKKSPEELRKLLELRRCGASGAVESKKQYKRIRQTTRKMLDLEGK